VLRSTRFCRHIIALGRNARNKGNIGAFAVYSEPLGLSTIVSPQPEEGLPEVVNRMAGKDLGLVICSRLTGKDDSTRRFTASDAARHLAIHRDRPDIINGTLLSWTTTTPNVVKMAQLNLWLTVAKEDSLPTTELQESLPPYPTVEDLQHVGIAAVMLELDSRSGIAIPQHPGGLPYLALNQLYPPKL